MAARDYGELNSIATVPVTHNVHDLWVFLCAAATRHTSQCGMPFCFIAFLRAMWSSVDEL